MLPYLILTLGLRGRHPHFPQANQLMYKGQCPRSLSQQVADQGFEPSSAVCPFHAGCSLWQPENNVVTRFQQGWTHRSSDSWQVFISSISSVPGILFIKQLAPAIPQSFACHCGEISNPCLQHVIYLYLWQQAEDETKLHPDCGWRAGLPVVFPFRAVQQVQFTSVPQQKLELLQVVELEGYFLIF